MRGLAKRIIVVSGGASGIGKAAIQRLNEEGAIAISFDTAHDKNQISNKEIFCDVSDEDSVKTAFAHIAKVYGPLSGIVSNAAVYFRSDEGSVHELDIDVWNQTLLVNLTGAYLFCKHGVKAMVDQGKKPNGRVVVVGSPNGQYGCNPGSTAYSVSKAGLYGMARLMAMDYARKGIRVNLVFPGYVPTDLNAEMSSDPVVHAETLQSLPMGVAGTPKDIAGAITFLLSDDASFITGAGLYVDGGLTAR